MAETLESLSAQMQALGTSVNEHFVEQRAYIEFGHDRLAQMIDRLERKLDAFIDVQLHTNRLVERRLNALEKPRRRRA